MGPFIANLHLRLVFMRMKHILSEFQDVYRTKSSTGQVVVTYSDTLSWWSRFFNCAILTVIWILWSNNVPLIGWLQGESINCLFSSCHEYSLVLKNYISRKKRIVHWQYEWAILYTKYIYRTLFLRNIYFNYFQTCSMENLRYIVFSVNGVGL